MRNRRKFFILTACLAAVAAFIAVLSSEREPHYRGRSLTYWLETYAGPYSTPTSPRDPQAIEAITAIGTNAVPFLLQQIGHEPVRNSFKSTIAVRLGALFPKARSPLAGWALDDEANSRGNAASLAFEILGPRGSPGLPDLARIAQVPGNLQAANRAVYAMACFGKPALPYLLTVLENPSAPQRQHAALYIEITPDIASNAAPAIPALLRCLQDTNISVAYSAASCLGAIHLQPETVVPALTNYLAAGPDLREAAILALGQFGPGARMALPHLAAATNDPEPDIRQYAETALSSVLGMDPETTPPSPPSAPPP
jgi:hypothetical protein